MAVAVAMAVVEVVVTAVVVTAAVTAVMVAVMVAAATVVTADQWVCRCRRLVDQMGGGSRHGHPLKVPGTHVHVRRDSSREDKR